MTDIRFAPQILSDDERAIVNAGFARHSNEQAAPPFQKTPLAWRALSDEGTLMGVLTGQLLWDWVYIDELWVDPSRRGTGLGRELMRHAEHHANTHGFAGLWLWTQSWQAESFYLHLGYEVFARFPDFPRGHSRIGLRKTLQSPTSTTP